MEDEKARGLSSAASPLIPPPSSEIDLEAGAGDQLQCRICLETDGTCARIRPARAVAAAAAAAPRYPWVLFWQGLTASLRVRVQGGTSSRPASARAPPSTCTATASTTGEPSRYIRFHYSLDACSAQMLIVSWIRSRLQAAILFLATYNP
jgi:hypothetical protein